MAPSLTPRSRLEKQIQTRLDNITTDRNVSGAQVDRLKGLAAEYVAREQVHGDSAAKAAETRKNLAIERARSAHGAYRIASNDRFLRLSTALYQKNRRPSAEELRDALALDRTAAANARTEFAKGMQRAAESLGPDPVDGSGARATPASMPLPGPHVLNDQALRIAAAAMTPNRSPRKNSVWPKVSSRTHRNPVPGPRPGRSPRA